ncbi:hypothetical protein [Haloferula sargassicola]|uniref:DUF4397 domain-containing protein n=1 Tax=Haloferula sargassicola TaxID=490096 RepID=A0ABP9UJW9_9BACT
MRNACLFILAVVLAVGPAFAQTQTQTVLFRTLCLQHQDDIRTVFVPSAKGGSSEVPLLTGGFSPVYRAAFKDGVAEFHVDDDDAPEGKRVVARGRLASSDRQLFLFLPDPQKRLPYRLHCLPDDLPAFPMGGLRFLNLTPYAARLELAGAKLPAVKSGASQTYPKVTKVDEWNMYQARVELQAPDGHWATISSPSWKSLETKRDLALIMIDPTSRQPRILNFKDLPPWLEPTPEE